MSGNSHRESIAVLRDWLLRQDSGPISDISRLQTLLACAWDDLSLISHRDAKMSADKLPSRMESVTWEAPLLTFEIERHGGTVHGSSRAEVHEWQINVDAGSKSLTGSRPRQLQTARPRWDARQAAADVVAKILATENDSCLKWNKDRSEVRVVAREVVPDWDVAAKQTTQGRSKRLRESLIELLRPSGWAFIPASQNKFRKITGQDC